MPGGTVSRACPERSLPHGPSGIIKRRLHPLVRVRIFGAVPGFVGGTLPGFGNRIAQKYGIPHKPKNVSIHAQKAVQCVRAARPVASGLAVEFVAE